MFEIKNIEQLSQFARDLIIEIKNNNIDLLTLDGDLGAGKTTLTKLLLSHLGVREDVISPTFVYRRDYDLVDQKWMSVSHYDLYRLDNNKSIEEKISFLEQIDFFGSLVNTTNLLIVEWFCNISDMKIYSKNFLKLNFEVIGDIRQISINETN